MSLTAQTDTPANAHAGRRSSRRPGATGALLLLAFMAGSLALNWPYAREGFQADDFLFVGAFRQDPMPFSRWRGVWSSPLESCPSLRTLWWFEEGALGTFWRPVPSLVFEGSWRLFGDNALPLHLLSILLHGLVAFTGTCFLARLTGRRRIAMLAGVLYLLCPHHATNIGWIAAGSEVLCVLFLNLAFLAHLRWREGRRPGWLAASIGFLMLALASKESAAAGPLGIVLLEWFLVRPDAPGWRARSRAWLRAAAAWGPACLLLGAYLAAYRLLGLGGMDNLLYVDPLRQPIGYLAHAGTRLASLLSGLLSVLPPSTTLFVPASAPFFVLAGAALFVLWLPAVRTVLRGPAEGWVLAYLMVTLLPQLATDAHERLLYYPYLFAAYLLALLIAGVPFVARRLGEEPAPTRYARAWGWYALAGLAVPGALLTAVWPFRMGPALSSITRQLQTALPAVEQHMASVDPHPVVILNTPGPFVTLYPAAALEYLSGKPTPAFVLCGASARVTLERVGPRSVILRADRAGWLSSFFSRVVRRTPTLQPGRVYRRPLFTVTLLQLTPDRTDVLAARFDFRYALDDRRLLFLTWDGERFVRCEPAGLTPGEPVLLADTSDALGSTQ